MNLWKNFSKPQEAKKQKRKIINDKKQIFSYEAHFFILTSSNKLRKKKFFLFDSFLSAQNPKNIKPLVGTIK